MATCKAGGKVKKANRKRKVFQPSMRSKNIPNKHRMIPVKVSRGFHPKSLQMNTSIPGIFGGWVVDNFGTITKAGVATGTAKTKETK